MLRFNAGGHINHSIFWQNLTPQNKCGEPSGNRLTVINELDGLSQRNTITAASDAVNLTK